MMQMECSTEGCQNEAICEDKDPICTSCLRGVVISHEAQKIVEKIDKRRENRKMSYDEYQEWLISNQSKIR